jgi:hypothetical protein
MVSSGINCRIGRLRTSTQHLRGVRVCRESQARSHDQDIAVIPLRLVPFDCRVEKPLLVGVAHVEHRITRTD